MKLEFHYWRSYGNHRYYPANEAARVIVEQIATRKCVTRAEVEALRSAGFEIVISEEEMRDEARRRL